jgi:hypothetical protein
VFLAGWILYEFTTLPVLGVVTICLKFGWDDFQAAVWQCRRDPNRQRAWACCWFYLASGLWKTAAFAIVPIIVIPLIAVWQAGGIQRRPGIDPPAQFLAASYTLFGGFILSAVATLIAIWAALRGRTKIWVNPAISLDRLDNVWPPKTVLSSWPNHLNRTLIAALITIGLPASMLCIMLPMAIGQPLPKNPALKHEENLRLILVACFLANASIALPFFLVMKSGWLQRRIVANSPDDCWADFEYAEEQDDQSDKK